MTPVMVEYTWGEYLAMLPQAKHYANSADDWTDGESFTSALRKMSDGDDKYVPMADKLLDKLNNVTEGIPVREWTSSVYGAYPVVPEFLMGIPECMRTLHMSGSLQPAKIVVSSTCSGGIDTATMTKRGVAILALLQKLQLVRAVELYILVEGNQHGTRDLFQMIRVDTRPLSIAHACFALASTGFNRGLTYPHMQRFFGWNGAWPVSYRHSNYDSIVRTACGMSDEDLWIRSSHMHDSLLVNDPVAWVNNQLARFNGE